MLDKSSASTEKPASLGVRLSDDDKAALAEARHHDPFAVLGPHQGVIRACIPGASGLEILSDGASIEAEDEGGGLFSARLPQGAPYRLRVRWPREGDGEVTHEFEDPYRFWPQLTDLDLHLFAQGRHFDLPLRFGSNVRTLDGVEGVLFAVWAPNARAVSVVGDFNSWDPRRHPMRLRLEAGVWELFIPGVPPGAIYKYAITGADGAKLPWKADPLAKAAECPPRTGSVVVAPHDHRWSDDAWIAERTARQAAKAPVSVYEVHVTSWLRTHDGEQQNWDNAIERLIPYVKEMGFTHIELMPVSEHPFGGSWGYQPLSLFAPTARLGSPDGFARFVDACHRNGIGVLVDWVPAHFPTDAHGMAQFDGTHLYEHQDPREGFHQDWSTLIYNVGRSEVKGFLIASALWWIKHFHVDGLRVDAVASMLYRDYSRKAGEWIPNVYGGRENFESVSFLQELNTVIRSTGDGAVMIAEESTAWPGVTNPVEDGGLGFHFKWNLGWMHDTLQFFERDPLYRQHHLRDITFGLIYAFSEKFVLCFSHDEVVHGKGSMLAKMPGDEWQKFANLRLCLAMMFMHPGKKLLFMGIEFGQETEWNVDVAFPWPHGDDRNRNGLRRMVADVNGLYRRHAGLHARDHTPDGFHWVVDNDTSNTVFAFERIDPSSGEVILVVANMTPVPREGYRVGVGEPGYWQEIFNSDSERYAGSNMGNGGGVSSEPVPLHHQAQSLHLTLPPLGLVAFRKADHQ
ncbi:MAG: 1,4-alpha-glucan branching protein GlgB [Beijerinckiaceae bacterium]|nr:1,4-alpha-glucan branching protein GlgB [Beijerinckiaceae bacterium]